MIYSMTAFARSQRDWHGLHLVWEVRSVNHRFLETHFRMPDNTRSIEHALRNHLRNRLKRGKLDCTLRVEETGNTAALSINSKMLTKLLATVEQVRREAPDAAPVSALDLLRWPGVLGDTSVDPEALCHEVEGLFEETINGLIGHRGREGEQLGQAIGDRLEQVDNIVAELKRLAAGLTATIAERLQARVAELATTVDAARLEQEIAMLAQRADVAEELDRLGMHVKEARSQLQMEGPHGRRLDFLTQELNREANTLGAKSILAESSQRAVDLKVLIEQIREQVQNVE